MSIEFIYDPVMVAGADSPETLSLYFLGEQLLLNDQCLADPVINLPWTVETLPTAQARALQLGKINGQACRVVELEECPPGWTPVGLRDYLLRADSSAFKVVNAGSQLRYWLSTQNFCSRCSHTLRFNGEDRALKCDGCGYLSYPKISPCIITTVRRGRQILLAQSVRYRTNMYSCLAGFIECGESAEEAVRREVLEESSLCVSNLRYLVSQSWPFPHQLMLGFLADYESGELQIEPSEIRDAQWFDIDSLPEIPPPQTIARTLIDQSVELIRKQL